MPAVTAKLNLCAAVVVVFAEMLLSTEGRLVRPSLLVVPLLTVLPFLWGAFSVSTADKEGKVVQIYDP